MSGKEAEQSQFIKKLNNTKEVMNWHVSSSDLSEAFVTINNTKVPLDSVPLNDCKQRDSSSSHRRMMDCEVMDAQSITWRNLLTVPRGVRGMLSWKKMVKPVQHHVSATPVFSPFHSCSVTHITALAGCVHFTHSPNKPTHIRAFSSFFQSACRRWWQRSSKVCFVPRWVVHAL